LNFFACTLTEAVWHPLWIETLTSTFLKPLQVVPGGDLAMRVVIPFLFAFAFPDLRVQDPRLA
jgi:hypothetical protein